MVGGEVGLLGQESVNQDESSLNSVSAQRELRTHLHDPAMELGAHGPVYLGVAGGYHTVEGSRSVSV